MAVIDINRNPSQRELKVFGLIMLLVFGLIGGLVLRWEWLTAAVAIWSVGGSLTALFYAVRGLRLPLYLMWMRAVYPIGWMVTHLLLGIVYYLVISPIGLILRLLGRDPIERKIDRAAESYWTRREPAVTSKRYFHQF